MLFGSLARAVTSTLSMVVFNAGYRTVWLLWWSQQVLMVIGWFENYKLRLRCLDENVGELRSPWNRGDMCTSCMRVQLNRLFSDRRPLRCDRFNRILARISDVYMKMLAECDHRTNRIHHTDMCVESWGNRLFGDRSPLGRDRFNRALRAWVSDV